MRLVAAMVEVSVKDILHGLKLEKKEAAGWKVPTKSSALCGWKKDYKEAVQFFRGGWFDALTGIDGNAICNRILYDTDFRERLDKRMAHAEERRKRTIKQERKKEEVINGEI